MNSPDTLLTAVQTERRPAIWPWLVMPLVTLLLFYGLDRLYRAERSLGEMTAEPPTQVPAADTDN